MQSISFDNPTWYFEVVVLLLNLKKLQLLSYLPFQEILTHFGGLHKRSDARDNLGFVSLNEFFIGSTRNTRHYLFKNEVLVHITGMFGRIECDDDPAVAPFLSSFSCTTPLEGFQGLGDNIPCLVVRPLSRQERWQAKCFLAFLNSGAEIAYLPVVRVWGEQHKVQLGGKEPDRGRHELCWDNSAPFPVDDGDKVVVFVKQKIANHTLHIYVH